MVSEIHYLPVTTLRLFNVYGPGQSLSNPYVGVLGAFFRHIRAGRPVELYEDGQMLRDFVYVDDVVDVLSIVTGNEPAFSHVLNVGTGNGITLMGVAEEMTRQWRRSPRSRYGVGTASAISVTHSLMSPCSRPVSGTDRRRPSKAEFELLRSGPRRTLPTLTTSARSVNLHHATCSGRRTALRTVSVEYRRLPWSRRYSLLVAMISARWARCESMVW